jgi:CheY-like chemotaxis protein
MANPQAAVPIIEPHRILSICDNATLLLSREMILRREGYDVTSVSSKEVEDKISFADYDLVILCNSVPEHIVRLLAHIIPIQAPHVHFLHLSTELHELTQAVCESFDSTRGPQELLHKMIDVLKTERKPPERVTVQPRLSATS